LWSIDQYGQVAGEGLLDDNSGSRSEASRWLGREWLAASHTQYNKHLAGDENQNRVRLKSWGMGMEEGGPGGGTRWGRRAPRHQGRPHAGSYPRDAEPTSTAEGGEGGAGKGRSSSCEVEARRGGSGGGRRSRSQRTGEEQTHRPIRPTRRCQSLPAYAG
jgi:hypothetical protein